MNAKKVKRLRKSAAYISPYRQYNTIEYMNYIWGYVPSFEVDENGIEINIPKVAKKCKPITLHKGCRRKAIKELKKSIGK